MNQFEDTCLDCAAVLNQAAGELNADYLPIVIARLTAEYQRVLLVRQQQYRSFSS